MIYIMWPYSASIHCTAAILEPVNVFMPIHQVKTENYTKNERERGSAAVPRIRAFLEFLLLGLSGVDPPTLKNASEKHI